MSLNPTPSRPGLIADERGAVMIMGLFMATMLIGAMWYMKGIGDAIVFRDRMQESADHVVFSSAAIHARGMNLISVINIVMYALTVIHVVLSVLKSAASVCSVIPPLIPFCASAYKMLSSALAMYDRGLLIALPALSVAGTAAAVSYPLFGSNVGHAVGLDYKAVGVAISPSNIPSLSLSSILKPSPSTGPKPPVSASTNEKLGLPVTLAENKELCDRAVGVVARLAPGGLGNLLEFIGGFAADCSGYPWETKGVGWKKMYGPARNGGDWLQVISFSFPDKYDENFAESRVALALGGTRGPTVANELKATRLSPPTYFAQSEFYFDCQGRWDDESCNGAGNTKAGPTEATFGMRWRARLKPVTPDFARMMLGALVAGFLGDFVDFALSGNRERLAKAATGLGEDGKQSVSYFGERLDVGKDVLSDAAKAKIGAATGIPPGVRMSSVLH